jgi:hypothetical protein
LFAGTSSSNGIGLFSLPAPVISTVYGREPQSRSLNANNLNVSRRIAENNTGRRTNQPLNWAQLLREFTTKIGLDLSRIRNLVEVLK